MVRIYRIEQSPVEPKTATEKYSDATGAVTSNADVETKETKKGFPFHDLAKWQKQYKNKSSRSESLVALIYLLGSMSSFCLLIFFTDFYLIPLFPTTTTMTDYIVFNFYLLNVFVFCMIHFIYHFIKNISLQQHIEIWQKFSYLANINLLISSQITILYYLFYDYVFFFKIFTLLMTFIGLAAYFVILTDKLNSYKRFNKTVFFISVSVVCCSLPLLTAIITFDGLENLKDRIKLNAITWELVTLVVASMIYVTRFPESLCRRNEKEEGWNHSEYFFHLLISGTAFYHFFILIQSYILMHSSLNQPELINFKS
ncbi:hypothetical protein N7582_005100 [Saccharomyces uvarum]|nr:hypothetical protein N7582_005100 [Saccharomyces uvarum]